MPVGFGEGLVIGASAGKRRSRKGGSELDVCGQRAVGVFVFPLLARECVEGKGGHMWERMDMCGDLWYLAVAVNPFICFLFGCINTRSRTPSQMK